MVVSVRLFAIARERAGRPVVDVSIPGGSTVADLRRAIARDHPALADLLRVVRLAVDGEYAGDDLAIPEGAEVALIPPVSGGAFL